GGAERLARARPASPAGGPGDSGGGGGCRLAHLQGRVRAAGGYRQWSYCCGSGSPMQTQARTCSNKTDQLGKMPDQYG
uniref:Serine/threonine kinase 39 n=1 Tax=Pan troglodytes TaxID=9598 RepID=A0A2I3SET9_PANTR